MPRLLFDYTWLYLVFSFSIIFGMALLLEIRGTEGPLFSEVRGTEGSLSFLFATIIAGRFHALRFGTKLKSSASWVFGLCSGLMTLVFFFLLQIPFLDLRPAPDGTFTHIDDYVARSMELSGLTLMSVLFAVWVLSNKFFINHAIDKTLSEDALVLRDEHLGK